MNVTVKMNQAPLRQVQDVRALLNNDQARKQLAMVATKHLNPERMMRVMANAIRTTPKLGQCEPMSFLGALMQCASLGLEPNTILGHAYLIPFDKKAFNQQTKQWEVIRTDVQLIVGYKGLIDLARRSGHITSLSANIHYSDDELWEYEEGTEARLRHRPGMLKGDKLHAYAIAQFKDGGHAYVVLPWAHVMGIRDASQGWQQAVRTKKTAESPWGKYEDEMAKKTAIRALAKYLPLSVEFVDAMQADEAKADYRAFAMDPDQGLQIEGNEPLEGEAAQVDEAAPTQIEDGRAGQQVAEPAPAKKAAAPRQNRTDDTPYTEMSKAAPKAAQEAPAPKDDTNHGELEAFTAIYERVSADLIDGQDPAETVGMFAMEIKAMKQQAPQVFTRLQREVAEYDRAVAADL